MHGRRQGPVRMPGEAEAHYNKAFRRSRAPSTSTSVVDLTSCFDAPEEPQNLAGAEVYCFVQPLAQ